jgi:hypothetical protein
LRGAADEIQRGQRRKVHVAALQTRIEIRHVDMLPEVTIGLF